MREIRNVLLAEDNANDLELTLTALAANHLEDRVKVVRDGVEAWEYLSGRDQAADRSDLPAVVLLDIKMPRMDGLEVLRRMKADPELRQIPVVMLTSSREERDVVASYQLGANAYVVKPVDFMEFVTAVRNLGLFWAVINEPPPGSARKAA